MFCKTKRGSNRVGEHLERAGIKAAVIHGNKSQGARTRALGDFKAGRVNVLVATDIAARGLDIVQLPLVVNFDLPLVAEDYIHRVGRTGRAGRSGRAVSLVSAADSRLAARHPAVVAGAARAGRRRGIRGDARAEPSICRPAPAPQLVARQPIPRSPTTRGPDATTRPFSEVPEPSLPLIDSISDDNGVSERILAIPLS